ncbi:MAG: Ig-like domain-containing protein [Nocardioides sp.]
MGFGTFARRHRAAVASWLALVLAVSGVVVYAISAQGYRAHQTQLNDGGIWVTDNSLSAFGRINKPIGQLDGAIFAPNKANLDVVQDGSAVLGVDLSGGAVSVLDPVTMTMLDGGSVPVPAAPAVQLRGGTAAVLDTAAGGVWAARVDPVNGTPALPTLDRQSKPLAKAGKDAALAVSETGTVYAASAETGTLLRLSPTSTAFGPPHESKLPRPFGRSLSLTTVGETPVALDSRKGLLSVVGGARLKVPANSVLQQPGPAAGSVLVATPTGLVAVDLHSGATTTLAAKVHGLPAAPVRLGACQYGAWSGGTGYVATVCGSDPVAISGLRAQTHDLVFRTNRGEIVLNDRANGDVWRLDDRQAQRLDNWDAFRPKPTKSTHHDKNDDPSVDEKTPPKARDDHFGARPGRSTVLHPLDNDSAPVGRLLSIRSVPPATGSGARVDISPDGQTLQVTLPTRASGDTSFVYYVDDGRDGVSGHATVHVTARTAGENKLPAPRRGAKEHLWHVLVGGTMTVPALADWRDYDGDPTSLVSARPLSQIDGGAAASATSVGGVRFQAPNDPGIVKVQYAASDGIGDPVSRSLTFKVASPDDDTSYPAVAEPDVVVGEVGKPLTVKPLLNDLPGADPFDPHAALALAGRVAQQAGAVIDTNLDQGTLTVTSEVPRTYFVDYQAAFGSAKSADGKIRVDVRAPAKPAPDPVAMPDQVTLHGTAPTLVDVLANDADPAGGLLQVQNATADDPTQLDLGVVDGRWVRISALSGTMSPNPQVVRYQISNGRKSGITGQIVVSLRPAPADPTPVTNNDVATVRAGTAVAISPLDNDFSPSGAALALQKTVADRTAGSLQVSDEGARGPLGDAYVVGRQVRYVAPASLKQNKNVEVSYVATDAEGHAAPGTITVRVVPLHRDNQPPEPPELDGRVVSGDQTKLKLPGSGVDPDGDAVTIVGLQTAPALGRILKIGANSIAYQAYPGSVGTDDFSYQVTDSRGARSVGRVRVVVAPASNPQPPLAVADTMTVAPGRTAMINVLANDLIASGDRVSVNLVSPPPGVRLAGPQGPVLIKAPRSVDGRNTVVVYRISNGLDESQSTVTLGTARPFNNPPVVADAFGSTGNGGSVTTNVLATAYDPDGPASALRVSQVYPPRGVRASIVRGSRLQVTRGPDPEVVPFVVSDRDGGRTTGSLYVPPASGAAPYVRPDALIRVKPGGSVTGKLADYVVNPSGRPEHVTSARRLWASPTSSVNVALTGKDAFRVDASQEYAGPGALVFEVTTARSAHDKRAVTSVLSVPVQVGEDKPILRCPATSLTVLQSRSVTINVLSVCHVWTIDPAQLSRLKYAASWRQNVSGLTVSSINGPNITVRASPSTRPDSVGLLGVSASGSDTGLLGVRVTRSPPPRLTPIRVADLKFGDSRTINLAPYLVPGVHNPQPTLLGASQVSGVPVQISKRGTSVVLHASRHVHGHAEFRVSMSDAGPGAGPERRVDGRISLDILDVPGRPDKPLPDGFRHNSAVPVTFTAPAANGAPIIGYQLKNNHGKTISCGSTACTMTGLKNGTTYHLAVRARNAVGWGAWSAFSRPVTPDKRAGQVSAVRLVSRGDHTLKIAWDPPLIVGSGVTKYKVTWPGAGRALTVHGEKATITGLDNNRPYRFTIIPYNGIGPGKSFPSGSFQSIGQPNPPAAPTVTDAQQPGDTTRLTVNWPVVDPPNGPGPVQYTLYRDGSHVVCTTRSTSCDDTGIVYNGATHTYAATATNEGGKGITSARGSATSYVAIAPPAQWTSWDAKATGHDRTIEVTYDVPSSHGKQSNVDILVDGAVVRSFANETGHHSRQVQVANDDHPYAISLRVCNENADVSRRCTSTSSSKSVQPYGQLRDSAIISVTANPGGPRMSWTIKVNPNGDPAQLTIARENGDTQSWPVPVGEQTFTSEAIDYGYDFRENVVVTLSDNGPSRGSAVDKEKAATDPPPPPTVAISRGTLCNDTPGSKEPSCNRKGPATGGDCTDSSCGFIVLTVRSFERKAPTCSFSAPGKLFVDTYKGEEGTHQIDAYYGSPGNSVSVTCEYSVILKSHASFVWPGG